VSDSHNRKVHYVLIRFFQVISLAELGIKTGDRMRRAPSAPDHATDRGWI
jgi:hypothetical protein